MYDAIMHSGHDSVMPYTPVIVRNKKNQCIQIKSIDSLVTDESWSLQTDWDPFASPKQISLQPFSEYEAWTDRGWSPILKLIRHKSNKNILRVRTICNRMLVDVTEDHSLMSAYRIPIRPHTSLNEMPLLVSLPEMSDKLDIEPTLSDNVHVQLQKRFVKQCMQTHESFETPVTIGSVDLIHSDWEGYVYDIQTRDGVFQAGIGSLIVKNTDEIVT
jgi:hypothetical protein